ncbi:MAG: hypothetical protein ACOCWM_04600, partial [Cyclobacteriaceae bacterium]
MRDSARKISFCQLASVRQLAEQVGEASAHCTHLLTSIFDLKGVRDFQLQIAQADAQTEICKRAVFLP